jgi:alpha-glucuronidase
MQEGHHYGPDPGFKDAPRLDWSNVYFHRADQLGIGFDRSHTGSNAVSQYHSPLREQFDRMETCPLIYLMWFHHVPWSYRLPGGATLWEELKQRYDSGVAFVERMLGTWKGLQSGIDPLRHVQVSERLEDQLVNAREWRRTCVEYFHRYAG